MSTAEPVLANPPVAPKAGADLQAARERLAWPLPAVAAELRIRLPHLEALEQGRISLLPGNAYALGFLRAYARALGLDAEEMVRRFKVEAAEVNRKTELTFPAPVPERGLPAGAMVLVGLVLAVGVYAGWYRLSGEGRLPAEAVMSVPERLAPLADQAVPPANPPIQPRAVAAADAPETVPDAPSPLPAAAPVAAAPVISPVSAAAAPVNPLPVVASLADPPAGSPAAVAAMPEAPGQDQPRLVVRANADSWLLVKDHAGVTLLNRTLKAGETWPVPAVSGLLLTTGNAGGTELVLDGQPTPSLGGLGAVRRDLPLDPDQIKDGKLASLPAGQASASHTHQ
ncbi:MAG TPA: RodZ domain-containing protein [Acetobacteraceae bacterium]